jgi:alkyl hydroperoxide reductase subunit AhpC
VTRRSSRTSCSRAELPLSTKHFTFVCPTEIVGYGELKRDFDDRDADLIGASTDTAHVHFAWRKSDERLAEADFPWIADSNNKLAVARGILLIQLCQIIQKTAARFIPHTRRVG